MNNKQKFSSIYFVVFRDLLAVIASSERQMFRIKFSDDTLMSDFTEFLLRRLSFDNISTTLSVDDVNIYL